MGYDFTPRNKAAGDYYLSAFAWPFMLHAGLGLVLGTAERFAPGEFIYITRPDKKCVQYNDGAYVSARESKELAKVARWIARVQEARIKQWENIPVEERSRMEAENRMALNSSHLKIYELPWALNVVKGFTAFADWAEKSGGFNIS